MIWTSSELRCPAQTKGAFNFGVSKPTSGIEHDADEDIFRHDFRY
jgi:hypothetical protein